MADRYAEAFLNQYYLNEMRGYGITYSGNIVKIGSVWFYKPEINEEL